MENLAYIGLSQQVALQQQMDQIANNLANMSTPGYKTQSALFTDYLGGSGKADQQIRQSTNFKGYRDLAPGSITQTYNQLDLAIQSEGYFGIQSGNATKYTRDGSFSLNEQRQIVNADGDIVQSDGGGAITVPQDAGKITVTATGDVATDDGVLGKLKIVTFADEQKLQNIGSNLLDAAGQAEVPVDAARIVQGAVEGSNVNPIVEMTKMTEVSRLFQMAQSYQQSDHDRQRKMIQSLTKTA